MGYLVLLLLLIVILALLFRLYYPKKLHILFLNLFGDSLIFYFGIIGLNSFEDPGRNFTIAFYSLILIILHIVILFVLNLRKI